MHESELSLHLVEEADELMNAVGPHPQHCHEGPIVDEGIHGCHRSLREWLEDDILTTLPHPASEPQMS